MPAAGFALETPSGWLDASVAAASKALEQLGASYPALAATLQLGRASDLLTLVCVAPSGYPNLSVGGSVSPAISLQRLGAPAIRRFSGPPSR